MTIPDTIDIITGYKALHVHTGRKPTLSSPQIGTVWPHQQRLEAQCRTMPLHRKQHRIAHTDCSCGIYIVNTPEACLDYTSRQPYIICKVALWGTVTPASQGARGQYAYPQTIEYADNVDDKTIQRLAKHYGLTVPQTPVPALPPRHVIIQLQIPTAPYTGFTYHPPITVSGTEITVSNLSAWTDEHGRTTYTMTWVQE